MCKPEIRKSEVTELNILLDIFNSSRLEAGCYSNNDMQLDEFKSITLNEEIYVATNREGMILGFIGVWVPDKFIHHLYISPKQQHKGIAKLLLLKSIETYKLPLTLKCDDCNVNAKGFYEHCGLLAISAGVGDYGSWTEYVLKNELCNT